jgi:hypothetical protein
MASEQKLWIPDPTIPVRVLGRDYLAWQWKDAPERHLNVFVRLEDDLEINTVHLEKILVLKRRDSANVVDQLRVDARLKTIPRVKSLQVKTDSEPEEFEIRDWLYSLGIPFQTPVVVSDHNVMLSTWKTVVRFFETWEWMHDILVFDETLQWSLFFDHEDWIHFHSRNPQSTTASDQLE